MLGLIISIHEFGHFIAAKKSGVYVEEFSLGMGPLIKQFKPKKSETKYSLRAFPIGGYVAMAEREMKGSKIKKEKKYTVEINVPNNVPPIIPSTV